jgi:ParB/RepB/Spo0J family partition protein
MDARKEGQRLTPESPQIVMLRLDDLEADPQQGRKRYDTAALEGLAKSIRECGVLEPILVAPKDGAGKHRIIAGERRWRAARLAELEAVPCIVREGGRPALDQLVENFQREDLDAVAKAEQIKQTMAQTGLDARGVAARAGLSLIMVQRYLRLVDAPEILRKAVSSGLRVKVGADEQTRVLDWTHGLEALRLYTAVFEPVDPTEKKMRALMRLEALLRRALKEDWNRARWLACAESFATEKQRGRRSDATAATDAEPTAVGEPGPIKEPAARDAAPIYVASTAEAVMAEVREPDDGALFTRRDRTLIVYLDRVAESADAVRRAELLRELDAVLAAVRRLPSGTVPARPRLTAEMVGR